MLIALLAAAAPSHVGQGFFAGVHGGIASLSVKKVFENDAAKAAFAEKVKADPTLKSPEVDATATNGIAGIHAGFARRLANSSFGLGGLLEGTFLFGKNLRVNDVDTKKDADFGVNVLAQARVYAGPAAFFGLEAGLGTQQVKSSTAAAKWPFAPLLGGFVGVGVGAAKKVVFTANVRYAFPVKQGAVDGLSSKPSSLLSTVGVSYYFG